MDFDVGAFLLEPLRPASVATVTASGRPALATMWFCFADDAFWLHSPVGGPFTDAADHGAEVAIMVETFDPTGRVIQVRATGRASIPPCDVERVRTIYDRYLGPDDLWTESWREQTDDASYVLWTIEPTRGAAVRYPELRDAGGVFRWSSHAEFIDAVRAAATPAANGG